MAVLEEGIHTAEFIVREESDYRSRTKDAVLASGNNLDAGAVVAMKLTDSATISAAAGNTGDADISGVTVTPGAEAQHGTYICRCTNAASANAEVFSVQAPDGMSLASVTAGVAYTAGAHIDFTLPNNGTTDWAVGDEVYVEVGSGEWTELDPDATNGAQIAAGFLYGAVDATSAAQHCIVVNRVAIVNDKEITWPDGITDQEKAVATAQLEAKNLQLYFGDAVATTAT